MEATDRQSPEVIQLWITRDEYHYTPSGCKIWDTLPRAEETETGIVQYDVPHSFGLHFPEDAFGLAPGEIRELRIEVPQ